MDSYVIKLKKYSITLGWPEPIYKVIPRFPVNDISNSGPFYACEVNVGNDLYFSSYPDEYRLEEEAKEFAAKKAYLKLIEKVNDSHSSDLNVINDMETVEERILKIVENRHNGMWADCIAALYTNKYKEVLPTNWISKVSSFPRLTVDKVYDGRYIVSPNSVPSVEDMVAIKFKKILDGNPFVSSTFPRIHAQSVPSDEFWDVYITHVDTSGKIWMRIFCIDYGEMFNIMSSDMNLHYVNAVKELPSPPNDLKVGRYFAVQLTDKYSIGDNWLRVCIQNIDWIAETATCWLIDHGDSIVLNINQIYPLAKKFTYLPRQAVLCSLAGLDDYVMNELFVDCMVKMFVGKILIAQVVSRQDNEYSLILFDKIEENFLNLNEELIRFTSLVTAELKLPDEQGVKEVYVCLIKDNGQLFVQIESDVYSHLKYLMENLDTSSILENCFQSNKEMIIDKMYLAKYDEDGLGYRAVIKMIPSSDETQVEVTFVDYGNTAFVNVSNVSDLEAVSPIICRIPKQALPVSLHGLDDIRADYCVNKLKEMISDAEPVVLKVISSSTVPKVEIFTRTSSVEGDVLISVNNSISLERNLIRSSRRRSTRRSCSRRNPPPMSRRISPVAPFVDTIRHNLKPPVIPNIESEFFDVLVTSVAHPHNFVVQPMQHLNELKQLLIEMNEFYNENGLKNSVSCDNIVEGGLYAALFKDQWFRVTVVSTVGDIISAYSWDFGECTFISGNNLRYLAPKFTALSYQGIKAKLSGIVPTHGNWKNEDKLRFHDLVADKLMVSIIKEKGPDVINPSLTVLGLQLIDTSTVEDINISHLLIKEKRAVLKINKETK